MKTLKEIFEEIFEDFHSFNPAKAPIGLIGMGHFDTTPPHNKTGTTAGWSRSPQGKEFELPDDMENEEKESLPGEESDLERPPTVGAPIPTFFSSNGLRNNKGFRRR